MKLLRLPDALPIVYGEHKVANAERTICFYVHYDGQPVGYLLCPESFLQKLEIKRYAFNTAKTYIMCFEAFINCYKDRELINIDENDIRNYLQKLV